MLACRAVFNGALIKLRNRFVFFIVVYFTRFFSLLLTWLCYSYQTPLKAALMHLNSTFSFPCLRSQAITMHNK